MRYFHRTSAGPAAVLDVAKSFFGGRLAPAEESPRRRAYHGTLGRITISARPDVYADPKYLNHEVFPRYLQELERDANQLNEPYQVPGNFKIDEFNNALAGYVDKIWKNQGDPNPSFMKTMNDELQNVLNLPR